MRINGLALSLMVTLALVSRAQADNDIKMLDPTDISNNEQVVATDYESPADMMADPAPCSPSMNTGVLPEGWARCLFGSRCGYHLYAGTEFTFLNVHTQTGGRTTVSFTDTTAPGVSSVSFTENNGVDDWGYAPRVWLGAQLTDVWGVRGRYWRLSDNDLHSPEITPGTTPTGTNFATFETTDRMEAFTADVEAVRSMEWRGWKADAFVGGRHAEFSTDSNNLAFGVFTTGNFINLTLQNGCEFDGSGVTYGGELRHRLGNSHLYAFGSVRGSALDGHSDSFARADGAVASSPSAPLVGAATVRRNDAEARLYIFEVQGGLEFEWALEEIPANFFFRTAYEYQRWDIDGLPTGGAGFGGTIGEITTNSFSSANLGGMNLYGVSIGTGLTW
ncbi:MAG TPA: hypothetical protein VFW73_10200 [Lacipirellulaceae bacterium]|nr:hypothetical protein [Lacipirellulaceae bacterium]